MSIISKHRKDLICIGILLLLDLLFFWRVLFLGECFYGGDILNQFYPWKAFLIDQVKLDRLPLWNPFAFGGNPFAANYQVAMWYPIDLIFFLFSIATAFRISGVLHFFLAGFFMYILCRHFKLNRPGSLAGGMIFMFSGFLLCRLQSGNFTLVTTYPWIPLIFYAFDKFIQSRNTIFFGLFSLALACQVLGGHPQPAYYTILMVSLYALYLALSFYREKKDWKPAILPLIFFGLGVLLTLGLTAIQLLPSWELSKYSATRAGGATYTFATGSSLSWTNLILFFAPFSFGVPMDETYWMDYSGYGEVCGYVGIFTWVLALYGIFSLKNRTTRFFLLLFVVSSILAIGKYDPLNPFFFNFIPGYKLFRCPGRWLMMIDFSLAFLAAAGFHSLLVHQEEIKESPYFRKAVKIISVVAVLLILFVIFLWVGQGTVVHWVTYYEASRNAQMYRIPVEQIIPRIPIEPMYNRYDILIREIGVGVILFTIIAGLFWAIRRKLLEPSFLKAIILLIILLDIWRFGFKMLQTEPADQFQSRFQSSDAIQFLQKETEPVRLITMDDVLSWKFTDESFEYRPNRLMIHRIYETRGYDPTILRHYWEYLNIMQSLSPGFNQSSLGSFMEPKTWKPGLVNLLNVKYLDAFNPQEFNPPIRPVFQGRVQLYENPNYLPRAFSVPAATIIPDNPLRLKYLADSSFNPQKTVVLETQPAGIPDSLFQKSSTEIQSKEKAVIQLQEMHADFSHWQVEMVQEGFILFSEIWYPGWKMLANGKEIPIYKADHTFRAIYLPRGKYHLEMSFLSPTYYWGRKISELSLLLLLGLFLYPSIKKRFRP